ncbi:MAG: N-acetyltransferase [Spirochaetes bacterium]|nr:N-acetyltransferase [Spirochaetota bacterium]
MKKNSNLYIVKGQFSIVNGDIGEETVIWNFVNIMEGARVGKRCTVCDYVFIETGADIGNDVIIKNNVQIWKGVTIADAVFVGPGVVFVNDRYPRSRMIKQIQSGHDPEDEYAVRERDWLEKTVLQKGCSIGANATILCGVKIGEMAIIGAGSVVLKDVPPRSVVAGNPAKIIRRNIDR